MTEFSMKNLLHKFILIGFVVGVIFFPRIADAVFLNPDGLGQVLIYPYYTANGGNQTVFTVANHQPRAKALKLRILESRNGREVASINVYLGPRDIWTAAIFPIPGEEGAGLISLDSSCTVPQIQGNTSLPVLSNGLRYLPLSTSNYAGLDNGPRTLDRLRDGHIEVIEMATLTNASNASAAAVSHTNSRPANCAQLTAAWEANPIGYWKNNALIDTDSPSGGLSGTGAIIDIAKGSMLNFSADALDGWRTGVLSQVHTPPGDPRPRIIDAANLQLPPPAGVESVVFINGTMLRSTWVANNDGPTGGPIDGVSAVLAYDNLYNEFATESAVAGKSEWVVTFPTKRYHTDAPSAAGNYNVPSRPFTVRFPTSGTAPGKACEPIGFAVFNREEQSTVGDLSWIPDDDSGGASYCYATQLMALNQTGSPSKIFSSSLAYALNSVSSPFGGGGLSTPTFYEIGWIYIDLGANNHIGRPSLEGHQYRGLPVTGFWAATADNLSASPGVRAYYGGAFRHRGNKFCFSGSIAAPLACVSAP
jgi:hypothetical protein